jgi:hypothetical protein
MKFALINHIKTEATKGAIGICPNCGSKLIAKCGDIKINHWSHAGNRNCDPWWENETDWHRSWKENFPKDWQEVIHHDDKGEKHIADVKSESGWVIEFQHSFLKPEERRARNAFYKKIVWVVDGLRRESDRKQFLRVLKENTVRFQNLPILIVSFPEECRLLKEWKDTSVLVFFDFHKDIDLDNSGLWLLLPAISSKEAYLATFSREVFTQAHNKNEFDNIVKSKIEPVINLLIEESKRVKQPMVIYNRPNNSAINKWLLANRPQRRGRL